jgi:hypothetical protein
MRPAEDAVVAVIRQTGLESFSLTPSDGWFRGHRDRGWVITVALEQLDTVAGLAEALRAAFEQDGVGVEAFGHYLRCRAGHGSAQMVAELAHLRSGSRLRHTQWTS